MDKKYKYLACVQFELLVNAYFILDEKQIIEHIIYLDINKKYLPYELANIFKKIKKNSKELYSRSLIFHMENFLDVIFIYGV